jgi:hypothetical protein
MRLEDADGSGTGRSLLTRSNHQRSGLSAAPSSLGERVQTGRGAHAESDLTKRSRVGGKRKVPKKHSCKNSKSQKRMAHNH